MKLGHPRLSTLLDYDGGTATGIGRVRRHLARCPACRDRLARARGIRAGTRRITEAPLPAGLRERIEESLASGQEVILPYAGVARAGRRPDRAAYRVAGLLVLGAAGGAAAATLAPPIAELLRGRADAPAGETSGAHFAGIEVPVPAGGLRVRIQSPHPDLALRVELRQAPRLEVVGSGDAGSASFRPEGNLLTIVGPGAGELRIGVPRDGGPVWLEIEGREILSSDGRRILLSGDPVERAEVLLRMPPRRPDGSSR